MEEALVMPQSMRISLPEWVKNLWIRIKQFLANQKTTIITAGSTALLLDVVTGIIFGFGGAALFAAL